MTTLVNGSIKRKSVVAVALITVTGLSIYFGFLKSSVSAATTNAIEAAVSKFEDASLGVYSPLPANNNSNSYCSTLSCFAPSKAALTPTEALQQLSNVVVADPSAVSWMSPSTASSRFDLAVLTQRNQLMFKNVSTSSASSNAITVGNEFLANESKMLNGNISMCVNQICSITSAAGATVLSYSQETVSGTTATVQAVVQDWQQQAPVGPSGQIGPFNTVSADMSATYTLINSGGSWQVEERTAQFLPGQGPGQ
jgi:hypothetical protein